MKQFNCPQLGRRPASEFQCAGATVNHLLEDDAARARRKVYFGDATARVKTEWWFHRASHLWFLIARDTATDDVLDIQLATRTGVSDGA